MLNFSSLKVDDVLLVAIIILLIFLFVHKRWYGRQGNSYQAHELGISSLVDKVRMELQEAEEKRLEAKADKFFRVDTFDLEINFVVKSSLSATGGINHELVAVSGQTETSSEKVQKITLHMIAAGPQQYKQPVAAEPIPDEGVIEHGPKPPDVKGSKP